MPTSKKEEGKKKWDWNVAEKTRSAGYLELVRSMQKSMLSESEFIERFMKLPYAGKRGWSRARGYSKAVSSYKSLLKFDIFNQ